MEINGNTICANLIKSKFQSTKNFNQYGCQSSYLYECSKRSSYFTGSLDLLPEPVVKIFILFIKPLCSTAIQINLGERILNLFAKRTKRKKQQESRHRSRYLRDSNACSSYFCVMFSSISKYREQKIVTKTTTLFGFNLARIFLWRNKDFFYLAQI